MEENSLRVEDVRKEEDEGGMTEQMMFLSVSGEILDQRSFN